MTREAIPVVGRSSGADERVAAFDLGSNTARGLLARIQADGAAEVLADAQRMTALGRGLSETHRLDADGLAATVSFVGATLAQWEHPKRVFAVATAAARDAENGRTLADTLFEHAGVRLEIISGDDEARLSFIGALAADPELAARHPVVVDVGGRSTEVVTREHGGYRALSCPIGARSVIERELRGDPPTSREMAGARGATWRALGRAHEVLHSRGAVVVVGGTAQAVSLLLEGRRTVSHDDIAALEQRLCSASLAERRALMPFDPERAEIICGGLAILDCIAYQAPGRVLHISEGGVREGLLLERTGATRLTVRE